MVTLNISDPENYNNSGPELSQAPVFVNEIAGGG